MRGRTPRRHPPRPAQPYVPANSSRRRGLLGRTRLLLLLALVVFAAVGAFVLGTRTAGDGIRLVEAPSHGSFHPVAGSFEPDGTSLEDCGEGDTTCLQQAFGNVAFEQGPDQALKLFDERLADYAANGTGCHPIAHAIGSAALARYGGDVTKAFAEGSPSCASGYYHGLLERAFVGAESKRDLVRKAGELCRGLRERGFLSYQCVHGLGHGLMIQTGYDLPTALEMCDGLGTGWQQTSCRGGVFMENTSTAFGFRSRWLKDDDPVYPCNAVGPRYRRSCYLRVTTRILDLTDHDWERTVEICSEVRRPWVRFCFRSYGRDASGSAGHDPEKILALCKLAGEGENDCLYGSARTIADTSADARPATALCERAPVSGRDSCFAGLGLVVGLLNATDRARRDACTQLTTSHAAACLRGARSEVARSGRGAWG